jgi:hypothetical protein
MCTETSVRKDKELHLVCVDFRNACDSVSRLALWEAMKGDMRVKVKEQLKCLNINIEACVKVEKRLRDELQKTKRFGEETCMISNHYKLSYICRRKIAKGLD